jgi:hypothetical protein
MPAGVFVDVQTLRSMVNAIPQAHNASVVVPEPGQEMIPVATDYRIGAGGNVFYTIIGYLNFATGQYEPLAP